MNSHHFKEEFAPHRHNHGRGWVEVFAKNLSEKNILDSMRNGYFYFSNGVKFKKINFNKEKLNYQLQAIILIKDYLILFLLIQNIQLS